MSRAVDIKQDPVVIHDYTDGAHRLPLGRIQRYGSDLQRTRMRLEHFDPEIKPGHLILLGPDALGQRTYEVLANRSDNGSYWAELAAVAPQLYIAGSKVG